jgi:tetratricopeptide (TPR) repeat protein
VSRRSILLGLWLAAAAVPGYGQNPFPVPAPDISGQTGDVAAAEKYAGWAQGAIDAGRWREAEAALERAADYAGVSSDLSYLLALARSHENRPAGAVLEAARRALEADRWRRYTPGAGRLLEAETLIRLRAFSTALESLAAAPESADAARLRILALRGLPDMPAFRSAVSRALERYPRDPRPVRILFETLRTNPGPSGNEGELIALALRRLPFLLESDPELAYLAVPFIRDAEEARRLAAAYRGGGLAPAARREINPASLPGALSLGVIDEAQAMDELFHPPALLSSARPAELILDRALLREIWSLLRTEDARAGFIRNLLSLSGVITEDAHGDGYMETRTRYRDGVIAGYSHDADQDGLPELEIFFTAGVPDRAEFVVSPGPSGDGPLFPVKDGERPKALLWWERYPAVLRTELAGLAYLPRPLELLYAPVRLSPLFGSGPLYPEGESAGLTRRALVSFSLVIERPSVNFDGALERIELNRGVPWRAREYLGGRIVSETEFRLGRPVNQRIDLDLDGRLETVRRFRGDSEFNPEDLEGWDYEKIIALSESDWDEDGIFEYGEEHFPGGTVIRSWDINKDGIREFSETGKD